MTDFDTSKKMKNILLLLTLSLFGCNIKNKQEIIRQKESIVIIQTLINQKGLTLVEDFRNKKPLPICLNLKKVLVDGKCFSKSQSDDRLTTVSFPTRTFLTESDICIEKIYRSKTINNSFFLVKDSIDIIAQNETIKALKIPRSIIKNFKIVEFTKDIKMAKRYIQFSIPIFSQDNTKAYLELDYHFENFDSHGNSFYLEKKVGKWTIKHIDKLWAE